MLELQKIARFVEQLASALPRLMARVERAMARMAAAIDALERALQAQIRAVAALTRQWDTSLRKQLAGGVMVRLGPAATALMMIQGRNIGWGLRDIARKLRPLSRIQAMFGQLLILVALILRWLRQLHAAIRAMHRDLKRALDRIADILIEGFRSLRVLIYFGFLHTLSWLRRLSHQAHASLMFMRAGLERIDQHLVMGVWFILGWLEHLARSIPMWGLEALNFLLMMANGVVAAITTTGEGIIGAINALGDKLCGCKGGEGEDEDPGGGGGWWDWIKEKGGQLWDWGKEFIKDKAWDWITWGLKKLTPWGKVVDWTMWGLDKLGVKDWLWQKGEEGVSYLWDWITGGSSEAPVPDPHTPEIDGPGGLPPLDGPKRDLPKNLGPLRIMQGGVPMGGYPMPFKWDDIGKGGEIPAPKGDEKPTFLPSARAPNLALWTQPLPGGKDAWLNEANRINRMNAVPETFGSRAHWLQQQNAFTANVTVNVPPGTPEQQAESMANLARRVLREEFERQLANAADQFVDATSPFLDHTHEQGQ